MSAEPGVGRRALVGFALAPPAAFAAFAVLALLEETVRSVLGARAPGEDPGGRC